MMTWCSNPDCRPECGKDITDQAQTVLMEAFGTEPAACIKCGSPLVILERMVM